MISNPSWAPDSAGDSSVHGCFPVRTNTHEKNKEKENKCKVIKAGCAGAYIKQGAEEPRRSGGAVQAAGVEAYGFKVLRSVGHVSPR